MKIDLRWEGKLALKGTVGTHSVAMDTIPPVGTDTGPSPKQLLLMSIAGCSAMDVASLMGKYRQKVDSFEMSAEGETTDTHPKIFKEVLLTFRLKGEIDPEKAKEACRLSMTQYCGVSAMVAKSSPIRYVIEVNGERVHEDLARFP